MPLPELEILLRGTWKKTGITKQTPPRFVVKYEMELHRVDWGTSVVNGYPFPVPAGTVTFNRVGDIRSTVPATDTLESEFLFFNVIQDEENLLTGTVSRIPPVFPADEGFLTAWEKIGNCYQHRETPEKELQARLCLTELIFDLAERYGTEPEFLPTPSEHQKSLFRAIRFMKEHLDENCSVERVAQVTGYSVSHFNYLFKTYTGRTPHEYYRALKLRKAKVLLLTTNRTVTEIASDLAFGSVSEFGQAFKKDTGMTPKQFRKNYDKSMPIYE